MPAVSVIMSVYNGKRWLAEAIESILAQTFSDFEFIIVDDGSQDSTAEIVKTYETRDDRIRFFRLEQNVGKAAARNHGIKMARGELVTGMDCDDVSLPTRLEKQVAYLRAKPEIGAVGTGALMTDACLKPYHAFGLSEKHARIAYDLILGPCVVGTTVMMRRKIVNACGGYDASMIRSADIELVSRLITRTRLANLTENLYLYRQHDAQQHSLSQSKKVWADLKRSLLFRLWGEAPQASLDRFARVRRREKIGWLERRLAKRDIRRLIEALIAANWVQASDRSFLIAVMNRQLERVSPRIWQMFCHWRRRHFGPAKGEQAIEND